MMKSLSFPMREREARLRDWVARAECIYSGVFGEFSASAIFVFKGESSEFSRARAFFCTRAEGIEGKRAEWEVN